MYCHKPLDRSQEGLECIVGSTFLLLLFSFWENSRRGRLKILSRKKNINKTKKGKTEFPGKTVNSQEAWHGEELEHSKCCGNSHGWLHMFFNQRPRGHIQSFSGLCCQLHTPVLSHIPAAPCSQFLCLPSGSLVPHSLLPLCSPGQPQGMMGAQYNQWFTLSH